MTAAERGPALDGADAAGPAVGGDKVHVGARSRPPRLRTMLGLARFEAFVLCRSVLMLAGVLAGGFAIWFFTHSVQPLWWDAAWQIGYGQFVVGLAVLVAAQLAAGRARRNAMSDLYTSFPATAGTRTLAHLIGLAGAAPAGLVLIGAAVVMVQMLGPIGAPSIVVLASGLLLVIAAGAVGVAIGTRFPHPLAGVLAALALLVASVTTHFATGGAIWLLPWEIGLDQLSRLPGPLAGYPPAGAHAAELAGIAAAAGIVALAVTVDRARARAGLAAAGILAVAVICAAGVLQLRPIPSADLNRLLSDVAKPASAQLCTTSSQVRYCLYPSFGSDLRSLEEPVSKVLAHVPIQPGQPLTVRQVVSLLDYTAASLIDPSLTHGYSHGQVAQWTAELQRAPGNGDGGPPSTIYLPVGSWPAAGGQLGNAHFDLALATAEWAVRIPPQGIGSPTGPVFLPCVPLEQAREAIAIWLAILATHPPASELRAGLSGPGLIGTEVRNTFVRIWNYPGVTSDYVTPPGGGPQNTAAGYLLASAMTSLPEQQVSHVLKNAWGRWLNWHTTDAQLAAALGIPMPRVPALSPPASPQSGGTSAPPPGNQQSPLCTG